MATDTLSQYKDIFGKPGEGAHSYRIANIAVVDVIATLFVALLITFVTSGGFITFLLVSAILFILGIILHHVFSVRTTIDKFFFP